MLDRFNTAPDDASLRADLRACCAAAAWISQIIAGRPHASEVALVAASDRATAALDPVGRAEALAGHPRIGERVAGRDGVWSRQEQSGVSGADDARRLELAAANADYEQRFGHVYLVCATGLDADELLAMCRTRLHNDPLTEQAVVLEELAKINRLRLAKLLNPIGAGA